VGEDLNCKANITLEAGKQVGGGGGVTKNLEALLVMFIAGLEAKSVHKTESIQLDVCNASGLVNAKPELKRSSTTPCVSTTCCHRT